MKFPVRADTRCWRYRAADNEQGWEGRIFPSPEEVPQGEGWVESPADVGLPLAGGEEAVPQAAAQPDDGAPIPEFLSRAPEPERIVIARSYPKRDVPQAPPPPMPSSMPQVGRLPPRRKGK